MLHGYYFGVFLTEVYGRGKIIITIILIIITLIIILIIIIIKQNL